MNYKTHNQVDIEIDGTSLQGYIQVNYDTLVELFGHPDELDGYKVDWEWGLLFDDGTVTTIYNWKNGPNYCGRDGALACEITEWLIGGHTRDAVNHLEALLKARGAA